MEIPNKYKHDIENIDTDNYYQKFPNVILSCYFTGKRDPIHHFECDNEKQKIDNFNYIKPLYNSCKELNLHLIIFHDGLSNDFINTYQTDKIIFRKTKLVSSLSINDERYIIYYEYLLQNQYQYVLTSDISDVTIIKDPFSICNHFWERDKKKENEAKDILEGKKNIKKTSFHYLRNYRLSVGEKERYLQGYLTPNVSKEEKIFVGTNSIGNGPTVKTKSWYEKRLYKISRFNKGLKEYGNNKYNPFVLDKYQVYNPGTIMASYPKYLEFIKKFLEILFIVSQERENMNWNMVINTYIIYYYYFDNYCPKTFCTDKIWTGYPFNSIYQKNEKPEYCDCCLIHK